MSNYPMKKKETNIAYNNIRFVSRTSNLNSNSTSKQLIRFRRVSVPLFSIEQ